MIEVNHLTKRYDQFKAADDVNLVAESGKITILLGPNGAGKSTTIKSIANLLKFEGVIKICGYRNDTIEAKRCFGYVPETPILYDLLTIDEHIDFIGHAYQIKNYQEKAEKYLELFKLTEKRKKMAKELSKGMTQKLSMLLAFMIEPRALLVDEPMVGLDPASIEDTLKLFRALANEGCAILISTHIIDIVSDIFDEAYIMNKGHIIKHVRKEDLQEESLKEEVFADLVPESGKVYTQMALHWFDKTKAAYVDFSQISCPVLVISGTKDKMTHPNIARRTAKNYRDSVLVSLTGADHMYESGKFQQKTLKVIKGWSQQNGFVD